MQPILKTERLERPEPEPQRERERERERENLREASVALQKQTCVGFRDYTEEEPCQIMLKLQPFFFPLDDLF